MKKKLYCIVVAVFMAVMMLACDTSALINKTASASETTAANEEIIQSIRNQIASEVQCVVQEQQELAKNIPEETPEPTAEPTPEPTPVPDTTPPQIFGVQDKECIVGQAVTYFTGVYATDDVDGNVEVTVETELVNFLTGEYPVTYKAVDSSGNEATVSCVFTVVEPESSAQVIHELAKEVIDSIITDDMLDVEKAKAIFDYVHTYMHYGNGTNNNYTDWRKAAYQAFTTHSGDCYNIWAMTKALLDETDIEYKDVERVKTQRRKTRHYWCIVNLGTGWYVFDPTYTPKHKASSFMWNEEQCKKFPQYWNYDKSILPELAKERFDYNKELKRERELRDAG